MKQYQVAFVGNPNVGKSAWINALSNAHFQVGNWPGVTVEKKEAIVTWGDAQYHFIDLPGCYSLETIGNEERITTQFLKEAHVDIIVNVLDATNLSRNLLLTLSLRELQLPMLLLFNFMDEVEILCDEIGILQKGHIVFHGTIADAKKKSGCKKFEDAYLILSGEEVKNE